MKKTVRVLSLLIAGLILLNSLTLTAYAKPITKTSSISVSNVIGGTKIKWSKVKKAVGYRVYKKSGKKWKKLADTKELYYIDKSVKSGKNYSYRIKAYKKGKKLGKASKTVSIKRLATPKFTGYIESTCINLLFNKDVKGADYFLVYRSSSKNGKYKLLKKTVENYFEDYGTITGKTYYYKLRVVSGKTKSAACKPYEIKSTHLSGDCSQTEHKAKKTKSVPPTSIIDGYDIYSCKCNYNHYAKYTKKANGEKMPSGNEFAYSEAVKRNNASVNYLNAILKKDKTDLLQVTTGTEYDIRILKKVSDSIVKNCKTDFEKIEAVYNWVLNNTEYSNYASGFPIDVYRSKKGDCLGRSNLIVDLLRLQSIPAATIDGYRGNTKTVLTENNMERVCGVAHMWARAYAGGKWIFMDVNFEIFNPDESNFDIAEFYYTRATDHAVVYYKNMNRRNILGFPVYVNGKYYGFEDNGNFNRISSGIFLNDQNYYYDINDFNAEENGGRCNYYKLDKFGLGEIITGVPIYRRQGINKKGSFCGIAYYNGLKVTNTVYTINGISYIDQGSYAYSAYSGKYLASYEGSIALRAGETIKLTDITAKALSVKPIYSSSDTSVLNVDKKGNVKAIKEGYAYICTTDKQHMHDSSVIIYVCDDSIKINPDSLAPEKDIKIQRSKIKL